MKRCAFFLLLQVALGSLAGLHAQTFLNPTRISTGADPAGVAVADLNGDHLLDIVWTMRPVLSTDPATVHTLLANSIGGYTVGPSLILPQNVIPFCRVADVNRDQVPDLICGYSNGASGGIEVFPGNGDGSFAAPIFSAIPASADPRYDNLPIIQPLTDLNGDSVPDIIVTNASLQGLLGVPCTFVLLGDGSGHFTLSVSMADTSDPAQVIDANGDGHADLLFMGNHQLWFGDGKGNFSQTSTQSLGVNATGYCYLYDMDGDHFPDAICGNTESSDGTIIGATQLLIFKKNGNGTFNPNAFQSITYGDFASEYSGLGTFIDPLMVLDLNGDSIPDILGIGDDGMTVIQGIGNLEFDYPVHYATGYVQGVSDSGYTGEFALQVVDMNGDGLPDLVTPGPNAVFLSYGQKDASFNTAKSLEVADTMGHMTVADFNEDGRPDLAFTGDANLEIALGKGDGTFATRTSILGGSGGFTGIMPISHGDFNGDTHQDLLAQGTAGTAYLFLGNGKGGFAAPTSVTGFSSYGVAGVISDLNSDGRDDIASLDQSAPVIDAQLSQANGIFTLVQTQVSTSIETGPLGMPFATGDFNKDGKPDFIFAGANSVCLLNGHGDGSFDTTCNPYTIPPYLGITPSGAVSIAVGDFDGDNKLDLAVLVYTGIGLTPPADDIRSLVYIYYGDNDGTLSAPVVAAAFDRAFQSVIASDLNSDGRDDLIVNTVGFEANTVAVVTALAGRAFNSENDYYAGTGLNSTFAADVNSDGLPDLIFSNGDSNIHANAVTILPSLGEADAISGTLTASPQSATYGQPITLTATLKGPAGVNLAGSITFTVDGTLSGSVPLAGNTAALTIKQPLGVGVHKLTAVWPGDSNYSALTLSSSETVTAIATTTALSTSLNPANPGDSVTFTATVTPLSSASPGPTGSVQFFDGNTSLATEALASGSATVSLSNLTAGSHSITAYYSGDSIYLASTSSAISQIIQTPTFALAISPSSATIGYGQSTTATVTVTPDHKFNQSVSFTCSGLPIGATCSFSPVAVTLDGTTPATSTLAVATAAATSAGSGFASNRFSLVFALGCFGLLGFRRKKRPWIGQLLAISSLVIAAGLVSACGGSGGTGNSSPGTTTSTITVTAQSGTLAQTATFTLTEH